MLHISFICWGMQKCFRIIKKIKVSPVSVAAWVFYNSEPYLNLNSLRARMHIKHEHLPFTCRGLKPLGVLCSTRSIPPCLFLPPLSVAMLFLGVPFSQSHSKVVCWIFSQNVADTVPPPSLDLSADVRCFCHLQYSQV